MAVFFFGKYLCKQDTFQRQISAIMKRIQEKGFQTISFFRNLPINEGYFPGYFS
jgi:hypothetical protein